MVNLKLESRFRLQHLTSSHPIGTSSEVLFIYSVINIPFKAVAALVDANQKKNVYQFKIGTHNTKMVQADTKNGDQIEKWHKRSFYQGPGVKFPFSWEKITLPPGLPWLFLMLKTTPLFYTSKKFFKM